MSALLLLFCFLPTALMADSILNDPYPVKERGENIYYDSFSESPKYLDPAKAYSSDEYRILCQIYEPSVQYHYLDRPYRLEALTATRLPDFEDFDRQGNKMEAGADPADWASSVWTIEIREGILFQNHPCFARDEKGAFAYHDLGEEGLEGIRSPGDFSLQGTRPLTAHDYAYQIKRMADPRLRCPIFASVLAKYIVGMREYAEKVEEELRLERTRREEASRLRGELVYDREADELLHPIVIDHRKLDCEGLHVQSERTLKIAMKEKYPQLRYWLAMPFFAPVPWEAISFYEQGAMIKRNLSLDKYPVGTGPFVLAENKANSRMVLERNDNFRRETYPSTGEQNDFGAGFLRCAGRPLPLIRRAIYSCEKESTPRWSKFMQCYYDLSGISSDKYQDVMDLSDGTLRLGPELKGKGVCLTTSVDTTVFYLGFNMLDSVVGGLSAEKCKLRQALSIAIDRESFIQVFLNGRGRPAQGPIPPGIFGQKEGPDGINPYVYSWDPVAKEPRRHDIARARQLLSEAGYPGGISAESGKPLTLFYDTVQNQGNASLRDWMKKQFGKLGVTFEMRESDYNRFR
ncbi:MAG: peptide ABC transporter substrate-binding protein, partial [Planctomycetes bacterium]|nr:peptide ABC transporter substrate-binding protein [Planctomycetota bacterium]